VSPRDGNEHPVVRIESHEVGISRELYKVSKVMRIWGYVDFITLFGIAPVVVNPLDENITNPLFIP